MKDLKSTSKFLSLVLRHSPEKIGLTMDSAGWVSVSELIEKCNKHGKKLNFASLKEVVETNDKKRFAFNDSETKIRASQGHSIEVDLEYVPTEPPEFLYHGTVDKFIALIKEGGLKKMNRTHVHMSKDLETATKVGSRRGKPIILTIRTGDMHRAGMEFFRSANGVWLCDAVPPEYIEFN
ncbi:MAG: 2-phosphotransferase [Bacteroidetes bacterium]|jgi:putative RNA 2'-phosphotransferase|nr:2-phosphotransferase [Bacteroidota bacterium]